MVVGQTGSWSLAAVLISEVSESLVLVGILVSLGSKFTGYGTSGAGLLNKRERYMCVCVYEVCSTYPWGSVLTSGREYNGPVAVDGCCNGKGLLITDPWFLITVILYTLYSRVMQYTNFIGLFCGRGVTAILGNSSSISLSFLWSCL